MPDPLQERMDALTEANLRLLKRVSELERRLDALEGARPAALPVEEPPPAAAPPGNPEPAPHAGPSMAAVEAAVGLNWVNRIGALTLVIGAAFFFKYAVDNDWIGPAGRILLGLIAGASACAYGFRSWTKGHSIFAQGVSAAGLALLYLSLWASFSLYALVPAWLAFAGMISITLLSGAFAVRFDALAMAALGLAGGYLTPVLLASGQYRPWFFSSYLFLLNAAWLWLARRRGWIRLDWLAAVFTFSLGAGLLESLQPADRGVAASYFLMTQYAVFALSPHAALVFAAQLAAGFGVAVAWEKQIWHAGALLLSLLAAGLLLAARRGMRALPLAAWGAFTAGLAFQMDTAQGPVLAQGMRNPPVWNLLAIAAAGFALAFAFVAFTISRRAGQPSRSELLMLVVPGLCFFLEGHHLLAIEQGAWRGLFAALLAAIYLGAGWWLWSRHEKEACDARPVAFCAGSALVLITVAIALQFSGFRITMLWAAEAAAIAWLACKYSLPALRIPAALLSLFVLLRLAGIDARAYPDPAALALLANSRFLTCAVSAAALGAAAWLLRAWRLALVPYLAAHAALLFGLALENYSWVMRTATPANQSSSIAAGLGVLGALYGMALVIAGVAARSRLNRLLGLGLIAAVVLKLYLADVWMMNRLSRILAFSALGALMLATSFFYSRFRARIEAWVRDDPAQTA